MFIVPHIEVYVDGGVKTFKEIVEQHSLKEKFTVPHCAYGLISKIDLKITCH